MMGIHVLCINSGKVHLVFSHEIWIIDYSLDPDRGNNPQTVSLLDWVGFYPAEYTSKRKFYLLVYKPIQ